MVAELSNAEHGLGYLLSTSQRRGMSDHIILILFLIGLIAFLIDRFLGWMQRGLFPYRVEEDLPTILLLCNLRASPRSLEKALPTPTLRSTMSVSQWRI